MDGSIKTLRAGAEIRQELAFLVLVMGIFFVPIRDGASDKYDSTPISEIVFNAINELFRDKLNRLNDRWRSLSSLCFYEAVLDLAKAHRHRRWLSSVSSGI